MKSAILAASAILLATAACASSGPYRAAQSSAAVGYSHQVIEPDRYRVQFRASGRDVAKAQDYALLRAAELTLEQGYSTFEVVSRSADAIREAAPVEDYSPGPDYVVSRSCGLLGCTSRARPVAPLRGPEPPGASRNETIVMLEIQMSNKDAAVSPSLYSASQVVANLSAAPHKASF